MILCLKFLLHLHQSRFLLWLMTSNGGSAKTLAIKAIPTQSELNCASFSERDSTNFSTRNISTYRDGVTMHLLLSLSTKSL